MHDYIKQITAILNSNFKPDEPAIAGSSIVPGPSGLTKAINEINTMIRQEVYALELQVVELTEQLAETERLLLDTKIVNLPAISRSKSGSFIKRRKKQRATG